MASTNDITGDEIKSRTNSKAYSDNYDAIFRRRDAAVIDAMEEDEPDDAELIQSIAGRVREDAE